MSVLWWCMWGVGRGLGQGSVGVECCYICVICESGRSRCMCIVLGGYLRTGLIVCSAVV